MTLGLRMAGVFPAGVVMAEKALSADLKSPAGVSAASKRLWEELTSVYEFRPDEIPLVREVVCLADDREALRARLRKEDLVVAGSKGQPIINPVRLELHRTVQRLESLVKTLQIPEIDGAVDHASWAGRKLARARWG